MHTFKHILFIPLIILVSVFDFIVYSFYPNWRIDI